MKIAALLFFAVALASCNGPKAVKPATVVATGGSANEHVGVVAADEIAKAKAAEAALRARLSKVGAEVNASRTAVPSITAPEDAPAKTAIDASLAQAQSENPVAVEDKDAREALERVNLNLAKDYAEASKKYASARSEADAAKIALAKTEGERDAARVALATAADEARKEREQQARVYQARLDSLANSVETAKQEAADAARKSFMAGLNRGLLGFAGLCALVGAATLFLTSGKEIVRAGIAFGIGALATCCAYTINQPWFKWVAAGGTAFVAVGVALWLWSERKTALVAKAKQAALDDAEIVRNAARKTVSVLDEFRRDAPEHAKALTDKLYGALDVAEKDAIHALRFEAETEIKAPNVATA